MTNIPTLKILFLVIYSCSEAIPPKTNIVMVHPYKGVSLTTIQNEPDERLPHAYDTAVITKENFACKKNVTNFTGFLCSNSLSVQKQKYLRDYHI
jgi:hypothetical protein